MDGAGAGVGAVGGPGGVRVRRVGPGDAEVLRAVRLAALADAPGAFWRTHAEEAARPVADWVERVRVGASGAADVTFLVERGGAVIGSVSAHTPSAAPDLRELAAMWVAPAARGSGAADALLLAVLDWARALGAVGVRLWVVPTNGPARRVYERHGFVLVGGPEPVTDDPSVKVYVPMVLTLDAAAATDEGYRARAASPWSAPTSGED
ncbi:GNAT family N-acetyltransferase [Parafrankia discariae]|uniref:GNAT family N-acetyltransferase n=1 Tax=Parafrankia discariae TaxID=365528 RepID=UPI00036567F1|nr:GNAT family N-acetyltransferase [Parafrankia discariae]